MDGEKSESKRARVRRLLIDRLTAIGMRFPKTTPDKEARRVLDSLCDALAFASDDTLTAVAEWARCHGDGASKSFFPPVVAFVTTAEAYEPRQLEDVPAIASWFASRAGEAAHAQGRLVAEFLFVEGRKRPPLSDAEKSKITAKASEWNRQMELAGDRVGRGFTLDARDQQFVDWYNGVHARAMGLVKAGMAKREGQAK